jgi:hypothetical protein
MQSVLQRAEKALADLDSLFITKKQMRNLLTLIKLQGKTDEVYSQLKSNYLARLKTLGLINSGIEGVPNDIATDYLKKLGITRDSLIRLIEAKRRKKNASKSKLED